MLKKTITYSDLDGNQITEDFYFHMSKGDLTKLQISAHKEGGYRERLKKILEAQDGATIISELEKIIEMSYGKRGEDGKRFIKSKELFEEFKQTEAYSELFYELATNADASSKFMAGLIPADVMQGRSIEDLKKEGSAFLKSE